MKQKYIDKLGRGDGVMLHKVEDEWSYVRLRYQEFMELFGKGEKWVALLNALSPAFAPRPPGGAVECPDSWAVPADR